MEAASKSNNFSFKYECDMFNEIIIIIDRLNLKYRSRKVIFSELTLVFTRLDTSRVLLDTKAFQKVSRYPIILPILINPSDLEYVLTGAAEFVQQNLNRKPHVLKNKQCTKCIAL